MLLPVVLFASVHSREMEPWSQAALAGLDGRLLQVHVVYRHGHREPKTFYPFDPHAASHVWTNGPTQLTILGRQQGFLLGQRLRARYRSLLPRERAWKAIRAASSDTTRTLMTSAVVLAGLLPPHPEDHWSNITWQPAAIHTSPAALDNVLGPRSYCLKYNHLLDALPKDNDEKTRQLYQLLTRYTGKAIWSPTTLLNLYSTLEIESQAGLDLPEWTRPVDNQLRAQAARALARMTQTLKLKRLRSGPLIKKLTNFQKNKISYKINLYCTHDSVLAGLLGSLGLELTEPPSFTATFIVEYRECFGKIHAQIWYSKGAANKLKRLRLPGCSTRCPLRELRRIVEPLIPQNWTEECNVEEHSRSLGSELLTVFANTVLIVLVGLCVISR